MFYGLYQCNEKVQVGKDQEKAQSEKDSHSKNRGGKKPNQQSGTYTMKNPSDLASISTSNNSFHRKFIFSDMLS